jgi:D-glycero-D-manno-heptose 1,7-bisphosphate phosphatase
VRAAAFRQAVFLDRDGVLNEAIVRAGKPYPPRDVSELKIVGDARGSLDRLKNDGFALIVVTNQPDVARGLARRDDVEAVNQALADALPLDAIEVCEHDDGQACDCRKPKPGLILRAAERLGVELSRSFMVGDRWRDIEAGRRAGSRTVLIGEGYGEVFPSEPTAKVASIAAATEWIIQHGKG